MIYIGIDPGATGAVAMICRMDVTVRPFDDGLDELDAIDVSNHGCYAVVERGHAMPKQGITSAFKFGQSCGRAIGWCEALGFPFVMVYAKDWQRMMLNGEPRKTRPERKKASIRVAQRLFPGVDLTLGKGKTPKDGASDALLIAEFARRTIGHNG